MEVLVSFAPAESLLCYLEQVPDPRGAQGRRHSLSAMLAAVTCAVLCGARGFSAISQWIRCQPCHVWHQLGFFRRPPTKNCYRNLLLAIDPDALERAVRAWTEQLLGPSADPIARVSLDGKTLRGSVSRHCGSIHLLSMLDQRTGQILSQHPVDGKTNEAKAALQLLESMVLRGRLLVGDAMFCQRDLCRQLIDSGGHYLFIVKDNQRELKNAIAAEFQADFSPLQSAAI
jgi:hypothetical protein